MPSPPEPLRPDSLISLDDCPAVRSVLWDRQTSTMRADELLHLYEDRWSYIDPRTITDDERALLNRLIDSVGNGVFLDG